LNAAGEPAGPEPEHYDGKLDDKDEAWAVKQRGGHTSDALLSCPCCLTTLCIDCQQCAPTPVLSPGAEACL